MPLYRNMSLLKIRDDFPFLNDNKLVYFDNACQSLRPKQVVEAINQYYSHYPICSGRSNYRLAVELQQKLTNVRLLVSKYIGAKKPTEIIFTRNTTEGINLIASSYPFIEGDVVLISDKEHNSNLVPWLLLTKTKKIKVEVVSTNTDNTWNWESFNQKLNNKVKMVSLGITSNLDGVTIPFEEIIRKSHQVGAKVLLDGAQWAGHHRTEVNKWDTDFFVFSGHKTLGPTGTGILYGKETELAKLEPYQVGGSTVADTTYTDFELLGVPDRFEAGLQDYSGILGLGEALQYLGEIGWNNIEAHEQGLTKIIVEGLKYIPGMEIIGLQDGDQRNGIVSFYHPTAESHQISIILDQTANIMVRSGRHCVHSWFNARGVKDCVRASTAFYNTTEEAHKFVDELKKVIGVLA
jgi:cysteine desulfurase/selenocysteine lyase